jgi:hypothetical protein
MKENSTYKIFVMKLRLIHPTTLSFTTKNKIIQTNESIIDLTFSTGLRPGASKEIIT